MQAYMYQADFHCLDCGKRIMHDLVAEALTKAGAKDATRDLIFYEGAFLISLMPDETGLIDRFIIPTGAEDPKLLPCSESWVLSTEFHEDTGLTNFYLYPPDDENLYDSDSWPKGPFCEGGGESDSPQHCGSNESCVNAMDAGVYEAGPCKGEPYKVGLFLENPLTQDGYRSVREMLDESGENLTIVQKLWADQYGFTYHKQEFESAHDWLSETLMDLTTRMSGLGTEVNTMLGMAQAMAGVLDGDQIQDLFQSDMDSDGYFDKAGWKSDEMEDE